MLNGGSFSPNEAAYMLSPTKGITAHRTHACQGLRFGGRSAARQLPTLARRRAERLPGSERRDRLREIVEAQHPVDVVFGDRRARHARTPSTRAPYAAAAERNSGSIAGRVRCSFGPRLRWS